MHADFIKRRVQRFVKVDASYTKTCTHLNTHTLQLCHKKHLLTVLLTTSQCLVGAESSYLSIEVYNILRVRSMRIRYQFNVAYKTATIFSHLDYVTLTTTICCNNKINSSCIQVQSVSYYTVSNLDISSFVNLNMTTVWRCTKILHADEFRTHDFPFTGKWFTEKATRKRGGYLCPLSPMLER